MGAFFFQLIICILFAGSMNLLLPLFNLIQLILLIPLLTLELPENLRIFIKDYLQFASFNFVFLPNPFHRWKFIDLSEVNYNPLNDNFEENGVKSRPLMVNYGGQLMLWTLTIVLYIPITVLAKCCKNPIFLKLKRAYEYGVLITSVSEAFLEFTLLSFLNITQVYTNLNLYISIYIYIYHSLNSKVKRHIYLQLQAFWA